MARGPRAIVNIKIFLGDDDQDEEEVDEDDNDYNDEPMGGGKDDNILRAVGSQIILPQSRENINARSNSVTGKHPRADEPPNNSNKSNLVAAGAMAMNSGGGNAGGMEGFGGIVGKSAGNRKLG